MTYVTFTLRCVVCSGRLVLLEFYSSMSEASAGNLHSFTTCVGLEHALQFRIIIRTLQTLFLCHV